MDFWGQREGFEGPEAGEWHDQMPSQVITPVTGWMVDWTEARLKSLPFLGKKQFWSQFYCRMMVLQPSSSRERSQGMHLKGRENGQDLWLVLLWQQVREKIRQRARFWMWTTRWGATDWDREARKEGNLGEKDNQFTVTGFGHIQEHMSGW